MFQIFAHSLKKKKKKKIPRLWLTFILTAEKNWFSLYFSSSSTKKYNIVKINRSVSISVILSSFSLSFYFPSMFS